MIATGFAAAHLLFWIVVRGKAISPAHETNMSNSSTSISSPEAFDRYVRNSLPSPPVVSYCRNSIDWLQQKRTSLLKTL
jgi:hypothetical protein